MRRLVQSELRGLDDEALIELVCTSDALSRGVFSELVTRHIAWLLRLLGYILVSAAGAEDVAQETLVQAYRAMRLGERPRELRPWLRVIATRRAFNHRRARKTRERHHEQAPPPAADSRHDARHAAAEQVRVVLAALPHPYREVLVLRYIEELEIREIASLLELGESAAKMRLARARDRFQEVSDSLEVSA